jgi:hypothetical protein
MARDPARREQRSALGQKPGNLILRIRLRPRDRTVAERLARKVRALLDEHTVPE